jgi:phage terminase large subunit
MSKEVHRDIVKDEGIVEALKTTWRDNKYYNGQYKNEALRKKMKESNPRKYGVQCNGNWGVLGELIYENWEVGSYIKNIYDYDDYSLGLDFGFQHCTAAYLLGYKSGNVYVLKELYISKLTVKDIIRECRRIFKDISCPIIADNARPEAIEEMRRSGVYAVACTKGANSVLEGIEWLQDRKIFIDESCKGAINEAEAYQWQKDKKTGARIPKPVKENDDAMDAIRYGCENFKKQASFDYAG